MTTPCEPMTFESAMRARRNSVAGAVLREISRLSYPETEKVALARCELTEDGEYGWGPETAYRMYDGSILSWSPGQGWTVMFSNWDPYGH